MPIKEEQRGAHPWIVFLGLSKVARPRSIRDFAVWASGSVVGPRHILTAAHVCKNLDLARRDLERRVQGSTGRAHLVCIPGFHGIFDSNTKVYPIRAQQFLVASKSLYAGVKFTNLFDYRQRLRKVERQDFSSNDFGMYLLEQDLPETIPRALLGWPFDSLLDPKYKRPFLAHGYPASRRGRLTVASTRSIKAFEGKFALEDASFGEGASGGPVWIRGLPRPVVIGVISGYRAINFGGPILLKAGPKGPFFIEDPKTGELTPLDKSNPPPPPNFKKVGVAARLTQEILAEMKTWRKKR